MAVQIQEIQEKEIQELEIRIENDSHYKDVVLNLENFISLSDNPERLKKNKEALSLYRELIKQYPNFAKMEKTTALGYFPNLKAPTHAELVYMMRDKLNSE